MKNPIHEQLVTARRTQILDAAVKLFASKGFHATTTKDIAREAGVAEGTVYIYFENKPALLLGTLDRMRESVLRDAVPIPDDGTDLRDLLRTYLRYPLTAPQADNFALFRVIISEIMVNEEMRTRYSQQILGPNFSVAEGYFRLWAEQHAPSLDVELTTHLLSAMVLGLIAAHIAGDEVVARRWNELPDILANLLVDGLTG